MQSFLILLFATLVRGSAYFDGQNEIIDDASLSEVIAEPVLEEMLLQRNYTLEELQYLGADPQANRTEWAQYGIYSLERKRNLYNNMHESECHLQTNRERRNNGVNNPVYASPILIRCSRAHSEDMLKRNYFSHTNQQGESPFTRMAKCGYQRTTAAENIAYGQRSATQVMGSWMASTGHRRNILNPALRELGVGLSSTGWRWTQKFGTPRSGCGNGFKESGEQCDVGPVQDSKCTNCQLASGASCQARGELDAGQVCGTQMQIPPTPVPTPPIATPRPTPRPAPTPRNAEPTPNPTPLVTPQPTPQPTPPLDTPKPPPLYAGKPEDLCALQAGQGCNACTQFNGVGFCKWCPLPERKKCMSWKEPCGTTMRGSLRTPGDCLAAQDMMLQDESCSGQTLLGCGGCVTAPGSDNKGCKFCPATEQCMGKTEKCVGALETVDACLMEDKENQDGLAEKSTLFRTAPSNYNTDNTNNVVPGGAVSGGDVRDVNPMPVAGMETWLIILIALLALVVCALICVALIMAFVAKKEKKSAEELRRWAENTGTQVNDAPTFKSQPLHTYGESPVANSDVQTPLISHPDDEENEFSGYESGAYLVRGGAPPATLPALTTRAMPTPPTATDRPMPPAPSGGCGQARALYAFEGTEPTDLSFNAGDLINLLDTSLSWWKGEVHGRIGNFPSNYAQKI